jgi:hypothetical protein
MRVCLLLSRQFVQCFCVRHYLTGTQYLVYFIDAMTTPASSILLPRHCCAVHSPDQSKNWYEYKQSSTGVYVKHVQTYGWGCENSASMLNLNIKIIQIVITIYINIIFQPEFLPCLTCINAWNKWSNVQFKAVNATKRACLAPFPKV